MHKSAPSAVPEQHFPLKLSQIDKPREVLRAQTSRKTVGLSDEVGERRVTGSYKLLLKSDAARPSSFSDRPLQHQNTDLKKKKKKVLFV